MQHNFPQKRLKHGNNAAPDHEKSYNQVTQQIAVYPKTTYGSDFGRGTNDPDNVRRQKQDYFDNWK
jgi:hypothetical protein